MAITVDIQIEVPTAPSLDVGQIEAAVQETIRAVSQASDAPEGGSVAVRVTGTATIQQLNNQYRNQNSPTDVLSFQNKPDPDFPTVPPEAQDHLGDIVMAYPVAQRQAEAHGHSLQAEISLLTVHGTLHLLGLDHDTHKNKKKMWHLQRQVMKNLGWEDVQPTE